jgi:hypothetical protein
MAENISSSHYCTCHKEIDKLKSMCKAAAAEIESRWEHHCDAEGYGPTNLLARLRGDVPPDYYLAHLPED